MGRIGMMIALAALSAGGLARAEDSAPVATVRRLDAALLAVLKEAEPLGFAGRVERLSPAVSAAYDVPFMAEKSLGQHWKAMGEADRQRWVDLSLRFSVANYAANFDRFTGQTIDLLGEEPGPNGTVVVRTRINDPRGEPVEMNYRLRQAAGAWKIVDVHLKGTVSELALRRADYTSVMDREGLAGLVRTMEGKIADLAAGTAKR